MLLALKSLHFHFQSCIVQTRLHFPPCIIWGKSLIYFTVIHYVSEIITLHHFSWLKTWMNHHFLSWLWFSDCQLPWIIDFYLGRIALKEHCSVSVEISISGMKWGQRQEPIENIYERKVCLLCTVENSPLEKIKWRIRSSRSKWWCRVLKLSFRNKHICAVKLEKICGYRFWYYEEIQSISI